MIGRLAFEKRDYITALCQLEKYFGGEERIAQAQLSVLEEFPKIQKDDWLAFRKVLDALETYVGSGPPDPHPSSRQNVLTMILVKRRLPALWYQKFANWSLESNQGTTALNFLQWASNRVDPHLLEVQFTLLGKSRKAVTFHTLGEPDAEPPGDLEWYSINLSNSSDVCPKCGTHHPLKRCDQFYALPYKDRKQFVLDSGPCLCYLGTGHRWEQCYSKARCGICSGKHHILVHDLEQSHQTDTKQTFFGYCTSNFLVCYESNQPAARADNPHLVDVRPHLVATAFAVVALCNLAMRKTILVNAPYDTGANNSTISSHVAGLLLLDGDPEMYVMEVSGGDLKKYKTKYCFVQVGDQYRGEFLEVGVRVLPRPCGTLRHLDWNSVRQYFPHFSKVSLMTPVNRGRGDRILGTDCSYLFASTEPDIVGKDPWHPVIKQT